MIKNYDMLQFQCIPNTRDTFQVRKSIFFLHVHPLVIAMAKENLKMIILHQR